MNIMQKQNKPIQNYKYVNLWNIVIILFFCNFIFIDNVYAYLDPGMGSYIFQIIIAVFMGTIYLIKIFWRSIRGNLSKIFKKQERSDKYK